MALKRALMRFVRAGVAVFPALPATLRWWWSLPMVELELTSGPSGEDIRRELSVRGGPLRPAPVIAAIELPADAQRYLVGRTRQAVRTNRGRALANGFRVSELVDPSAIAGAIDRARAFHAPGWATDGLAFRARTGRGRFWAVLDRDGRIDGVLSATVDTCVARINAVHIEAGPNASDLRFLLASSVFMSLAAEGVRHVITDRPRLMTPGTNYLQDRLGYAPRRARLLTHFCDARRHADEG